jgi:imidazolonepropionase
MASPCYDHYSRSSTQAILRRLKEKRSIHVYTSIGLHYFMSKILIINARLASFATAEGYGLRDDSAVLIEDGLISWVGDVNQQPDCKEAEVVDCQGRLLTPGLIDCHSHIVYGGDRAAEFELRLEGASYEEIAKSGGGIVSTVNATRQASEDELFEQSSRRLEQMMNEGLTTIEIKSGYGLDCENEIKMLKVAKRLGEKYDIEVQKTFLGAHALPPEFNGRPDDYINLVCDEMLPAANSAGLVDAVDIFIESIAFDTDQAGRVFKKARELGLPIKAHVEQLSNLGGSVLAVAHGALSVDHIEYLGADDIEILAKSETVAVILPGAFYILRETQKPLIEVLRKKRVRMAVATDANPGSSPIFSIQTILNMACTLFRMTPAEALRGVTVNAAKALGIEDRKGSIEVGKQADLVIWNTDNPAMLAYQVGINNCAAIMFEGRWRKALDETDR